MASYLKQLEQYGIVEIVPTEKRNHLYRLTERFFNMWLIVTQGNPDQKRRAKYLTLFLETWYDGGELRGVAEKHLAELREGKLGYDKAMVLSKGLVHSKYIGVDERDEIIDLTQQLDPGGLSESELPRKYVEIWKEIEQLRVEEKFADALIKIEKIDNEGDGIKFFLKAYCLNTLKQHKESETNYLKAIEKGSVGAVNNLACLYEKLGRTEEAETYYQKAIEKEEWEALVNLAVLYFETNKNPKIALQYILEYLNKTGDESKTENIVLIEIWNGIFDNLDKKGERIIQDNKGEDLEWFLTNLLNLEPKQLVLNLFESPEHGKMLQDRYELLYYATRILAQKTEDNLLLRIPPEVMPTVQDIVEKVKEKQAFYATR